MNNDNRHSFIPDSTLLNSLDLCTTSTSSFLTSTKDQKSTLINLLNNNLSHKNPDDELTTNTIVDQTKFESTKTANKSSKDIKQDEIIDCNNHQLQTQENEENRT
ncbi:unnamed protein product [Rotaria sp. Silwood2]|nr:unnamed protein product [Rotaria sp. Silwood2]